MKEPVARRMTSILKTSALAESSARWMQAGLEAFSRQADAHDFAVHHCAVAVEHLLKAYLSSLHPVLIVEGRDLDSLLHATDHSHHAAVPVTRIKTIGLSEALTRVERLLRPGITVGDRERTRLLAARNGVAHGGLHDPTEVEAVLATCIRIADTLLTVIDVSVHNYWGHYRDLHDRLAEERANSIRIRYESKLAHARQAYRRRFEGVDSSEKMAIVAALTAGRYDADRTSPRTCPACSEKGLLTGTTRKVEGAGEAVNQKVVFVSEWFDCPICGLSLDGIDEFELAKIPVRTEFYSFEDNREPWGSGLYGYEEYENYVRKPDEYDGHEPDYEVEDDPDRADYESGGHAWRGRDGSTLGS